MRAAAIIYIVSAEERPGDYSSSQREPEQKYERKEERG